MWFLTHIDIMNMYKALLKIGGFQIHDETHYCINSLSMQCHGTSMIQFCFMLVYFVQNFDILNELIKPRGHQSDLFWVDYS